MKKRYIVIITIIGFFSIISCNVIIDKDTTAEISEVSIKPTVTLLGEPIMSLIVGGTYVEEGIEAYVGDSIVPYTIVSGNVNPNQEGFYKIKYKAENQYGWITNAYRAVLVYSGSAYGTDITGHYTSGLLGNADISKYSVDGYWEMTNVWVEEGVEFPIIFADRGNGTYGIVPSEHPTKGSISGNAYLLSGNRIRFNLNVINTDGSPSSKEFIWTKQ